MSKPGNLRSIAIYSLKGGVGKTTIAVNLAWAAVSLTDRRTLLWDLDAQAGATWLLGGKAGRRQARSVLAKDAEPSLLIRPTATERLDLLPADTSLRSLDRFFSGLGRKRRLEKLLGGLAGSYDRIILDCPPGLAETGEQILRAASIVIVPVIPSPLSRRAFDEVVGFLDRQGLRKGALLPVYNMVDRRRTMHREALAENPDWPAIPMASAVEAMASRHDAISAFAPRSPAATALDALWQAIERRLQRPRKGRASA